jgi:hypothetical protein
MNVAESIFRRELIIALKQRPDLVKAAIGIMPGEVNNESSHKTIADALIWHLPDMGLDINDGADTVVLFLEECTENKNA